MDQKKCSEKVESAVCSECCIFVFCDIYKNSIGGHKRVTGVFTCFAPEIFIQILIKKIVNLFKVRTTFSVAFFLIVKAV